MLHLPFLAPIRRQALLREGLEKALVIKIDCKHRDDSIDVLTLDERMGRLLDWRLKDHNAPKHSRCDLASEKETQRVPNEQPKERIAVTE